jgi:hypothetical protein
MSKNV